MFSLIVFSITMMSVLNANFSALFSGEEARGGWDVTVDTNRNNPVPDLAAALRDEGTFDPGVIAEAARTTGNLGVQEARVTGNGDWQRYPVRAGDDAFFAANQAKLDLRARGYASDREVFEAVRTQPNLALIDILAVPNNGNVGAGPDLFKLTGLTTSDKEFDPITVEVRDPVTGRQGTLTVIGVFSSKIPQRVLFGLYTNERSYAAIFGPPEYRRFYLRLQPGANGEAVAKGIKAALVTRGVQARSIATDIDEQMRLGRGFNRIFQAFMGLGLFVGIAALGVIAFRSVVERRQQIGMLRALGYQRGTVALTFVLESSFVALMGILSGVVGAAILARNLFNSDAFTGTSRTGFSFFIPWGEVVVFVAIAYLCALLMTWWPSRGAARVPVAEALRYE
jgi:putative ABC transport system permease protein